MSPTPLDPNAVEDYVRLTRIAGEVPHPFRNKQTSDESDEEIEDYFPSSSDDE